MTQGVATSAAVDEPLELSAPIARELAGRLCGHDPLSGSTCAWYHGFWQYVRLLGLGASPSVHAARLLPALRSLARTGSHQRLLISGAADYSMLATVVTAYSAENARLRPVVVDMCATPLYMCRWYADRIHCEIATVASDIRSVAVTEPVDVVCTHAFLGYFSPADRGPLIAKWASLLRPGGRMVTVQRIRSRADSAVVRFTPQEKAAFVARVAREALEGVDPSAFPDWGEARRVSMRHLLFGGKLPAFLGFEDGLAVVLAVRLLDVVTRLPGPATAVGIDAFEHLEQLDVPRLAGIHRTQAERPERLGVVNVYPGVPHLRLFRR